LLGIGVSFHCLSLAVSRSSCIVSAVKVQKGYSFIRLPLVTSDTCSIAWKRGPLFAEGKEPKMQRKFLMPAFSHRYIKGPEPRFGPSRKRWRLRELPGAVPAVVGKRG